ncbi:MAG: hypothetical protein HRT89_14130 [Lentisphaeria bacterium]|nr:hypothetical protein [Lentisphaeria bacterium]
MSDDTPSEEVDKQAKRKLIFEWTGVLLISALFIFAGFAKLNEDALINIRKAIIAATGLQYTTAEFLSRLLVALEIGIGIALIQKNYRKKILIPLVIVILTGFSIYLIGNLSQEDCGCFGSWLPITPKAALAKNIVLIIIAILVFKFHQPVESNKIVVPAFILFAALIFTFSHQGMKKEPDNKFAAINELDTKIDLTKGTRVLAFLNLSCDHCKDRATELAALADEFESPPPVYYIFMGDPDTIEDFMGETGSDYPYLRIIATLFFEYIGEAPPRIYFIADGQEIRHWDNADFNIDQIKKILQK